MALVWGAAITVQIVGLRGGRAMYQVARGWKEGEREKEKRKGVMNFLQEEQREEAGDEEKQARRKERERGEETSQ